MTLRQHLCGNLEAGGSRVLARWQKKEGTPRFMVCRSSGQLAVRQPHMVKSKSRFSSLYENNGIGACTSSVLLAPAAGSGTMGDASLKGSLPGFAGS